RVSAVRALRHIKTPDVTQALVNRAARDEDSYVRKEAISLLAGREQQGILNTIGELLQGEPLTSVRRAALDALAGRPMDEELLALLSDVVSSDPDSSLRSYALELLGR
ncbi:MAG: HEAT repeat domain-containing protein, partial [Planctomycetes bacterium]|nr:HEAT repeat domain-containing protein [Planctomycetota bacterium]